MDLSPAQTLAQLDIRQLGQVVNPNGYAYSMTDMYRLYGKKFNQEAKQAYSKICQAICEGGQYLTDAQHKARELTPSPKTWATQKYRKVLQQYTQLIPRAG